MITILSFAALSISALAASLEEGASFSERRVEFEYRFSVTELPSAAKRVEVWIPLPPDTRLQKLESFRVEGNLPYSTVSESRFGNRFLRIDLSGHKAIATGEVPLGAVFRIHRLPFLAEKIAAMPEKAETLKRMLAPDALVPTDGKIAEEAKKVVAAVEGSLPRARSLFDHIVATVKYDKSGQGWGRGDAVFACDIRKGNCTDFHSLFIGQARSLGIPSRFLMGFSLPENAKEGAIAGYHCWGEFFVEGKGWLPVDASEAAKFPEKKNDYFAKLDAHRVEFTMGRDFQIPGAAAGPVNFLIYPHVEVDGKVHAGLKRNFSFREITAETR